MKFMMRLNFGERPFKSNSLKISRTVTRHRGARLVILRIVRMLVKLENQLALTDYFFIIYEHLLGKTEGLKKISQKDSVEWAKLRQATIR